MSAYFPAPQSAAELLEIAKSRGLTHVSLGCVDWDGRLRAKHYSVRALESALEHGLAMTTAIFAQDVREQPILFGPFADPAGGYPDGTLILEPGSARAAPYDHGGAGIIALGAFAPPYDVYCPRAIAAREIARYAEQGITVRGGFELEFRLLDEKATTLVNKSADQIFPSDGFSRMYSVVDQAASGEFLHDYAQLCEDMRMPLVSLHHEYEGMVEAALAVAEGIEIADRAVLAKTVAAIRAQRDGRLACFMARVSERMQSAGMHLNISLLDAERGPLFVLDDGPAGDPLRHFIGGLQRYTPDLFLLCAPNVNSYKRFLGNTLAPLDNDWDINDKTCAYRVVQAPDGAIRLEFRVPGADANPHLVLVAMLAAGRLGMNGRRAPGLSRTRAAGSLLVSSKERFPSDLGQAITAWRDNLSDVRSFEPAFIDAYARSRAWELHRLAVAVTDWELARYAACY